MRWRLDLAQGVPFDGLAVEGEDVRHLQELDLAEDAIGSVSDDFDAVVGCGHGHSTLIAYLLRQCHCAPDAGVGDMG